MKGTRPLNNNEILLVPHALTETPLKSVTADSSCSVFLLADASPIGMSATLPPS